MKTSTLALSVAALGAGWYFFFRKLSASSGTVTLTAGKRYKVEGFLSPPPPEVKSIMTSIAGSPAILQSGPSGAFVGVFDAQQPFAITIGIPTVVAGVKITVTRVSEV